MPWHRNPPRLNSRPQSYTEQEWRSLRFRDETNVPRVEDRGLFCPWCPHWWALMHHFPIEWRQALYSARGEDVIGALMAPYCFWNVCWYKWVQPDKDVDDLTASIVCTKFFHRSRTRRRWSLCRSQGCLTGFCSSGLFMDHMRPTYIIKDDLLYLKLIGYRCQQILWYTLMITVELIDLITEYISLGKAVHTTDHHRLSEEARLHEKWALPTLGPQVPFGFIAGNCAIPKCHGISLGHFSPKRTLRGVVEYLFMQRCVAFV